MHTRRLASNSRRNDCLSVYTDITHSLSGLLISNSQLLVPNLLFVVQSLSRVQLFATPWTAAHQASLSFTVFQSLLKFMSIESVMPSSHLILCLPLFLLPSVFPSIRVFSIELALCIRCPKYWSFSFSIGPSNEHSGLISFRIDWLDLLAVQGVVAVRSGNKLTQKVNADSGVQFITPAGPRQSLLLAKDPDQFLWKPYIP